MNLAVELHLQERSPHRVLVSVCVSPLNGPQVVDGVALQLLSEDGTELSTRTLLPISGSLGAPLVTTVELRGYGCVVPVGAVVNATLWSGHEQLVATCPADPHQRFRDWLRGDRASLGDLDDVEFSAIEGEDRARLEKALPWIAEPLRRSSAPPVLESKEDDPCADALKEDFGLDDECAEWLESLLSEPDD